MKIYDISQELLSSAVYEGDPTPIARRVKSMDSGELYNLTEVSMCVHNGTHIDAPCHFIRDGKDVFAIPLEKFIGYAYVAHCDGDIDTDTAREILTRAACLNPDAAHRILVRGSGVLTLDAARFLAESGVLLVGTESQSVGPADAPMVVHLALLSHEVVLLEGLCMSAVPEGVYLLCAQPINIKGSDGSPTRAILIGDIV